MQPYFILIVFFFSCQNISGHDEKNEKLQGNKSRILGKIQAPVDIKLQHNSAHKEIVMTFASKGYNIIVNVFGYDKSANENQILKLTLPEIDSGQTITIPINNENLDKSSVRVFASGTFNNQSLIKSQIFRINNALTHNLYKNNPYSKYILKSSKTNQSIFSIPSIDIIK